MSYSHNIPAPQNDTFLMKLIEATPARIGVWRSGTRPLTSDLLKFRADHAAAQDAVNGSIQDQFLESLDLPVIQTMIRSKEEYLKRPDLGRKLSVEGRRYLQENQQGKFQVQLVISDGLSSQAIEANLCDFLPAFWQGLSFYGISRHPTFFVKHGRVRLLEDIATVVNAEVYVILVGERPGLATAKSMSAYLVYEPTLNTVDADYTVVSNIHVQGTPPAEAAAYLTNIVNEVLKARSSGIGFKQKIKG